MDGMQELITVAQAERVITILALALPVAGLLLGAAVGAARRSPLRGLLLGLLGGLAGPAVWLLWRMYGAVVGVYGLDSVRGLLVNLALFVAIGLVLGLAVGVLWRRLLGPARAR